jgi:hypothetical protein
VGDGIEGYGCPPMSPIATGLVHLELTEAMAVSAPSLITGSTSSSTKRLVRFQWSRSSAVS